MLVSGDVLYGVVKYSELLLQELDAVVCDRLFHVQIEERVVESFILGLLSSQFVTKLFPHLLRDKTSADELL